MIRRSSAVFAVLAGDLLSMGATTSYASMDPVSVALLAVPYAGDGCAVCMECDADRAILQDEWAGQNDDWIGGDTTCSWPVGCASLARGCTPIETVAGAEAVEALRIALNEGDSRDIRDLVSSDEKRFAIVAERGAVQVLAAC